MNHEAPETTFEGKPDRSAWGAHGFVPAQPSPALKSAPARQPKVALGGSRGPELIDVPDVLEGTRDRYGRVITGPDGKLTFYPNDGTQPCRVYPIDATEMERLGRGSLEKPAAPETPAGKTEGGTRPTRRRTA